MHILLPRTHGGQRGSAVTTHRPDVRALAYFSVQLSAPCALRYRLWAQDSLTLLPESSDVHIPVVIRDVLSGVPH